MDRAGRAGERRWQLRDATAAAHHALDSAVGTFTDRDSYAGYLQSNYRFRAQIEPGLVAELSGWRPRRLLDALRADMADLGLPLPGPAVAAPSTGSALLGRLYVLEGAALGGQILRRRAATLGLHAGFGARHLSGDTANWGAFLHVLDLAEPYDATLAARGATETFERACAAFTKEPT